MVVSIYNSILYKLMREKSLSRGHSTVPPEMLKPGIC